VATPAPAPSKPSGLAGITSGLSSLLGGTTSGATKAVGGLVNGVTHAGTQSGSTPPTPSAPSSPAGNVMHLLNYLLGK
jgi:hypothetical protein